MVWQRALGRLAAVLALSDAGVHSALGGAPKAQDWPHLRGPSYSGVSAETGIVESWPEGGPPVLWRLALGQGYSGFTAVGGRLYTQTQHLSGQYVVCLDAATGLRVWRHRYAWPWEPDSDWPGPRATPSVCEGRVYFAGPFGLAGCLDAGSGRRIWSLNVTRKFGGRGTQFGYACSPLVEDGKVFLPVGGKGASVVALDAADGSPVWRSGDYQASYSSAYPISVGGSRQVVAFLQNVVAGFDRATGELLWEHSWSEFYDEHASWPIYQEPYLLTCSAFREGARLLRLDASGDGTTATLAWESKELSNDIFSSLLLDGHVYGFDLHDFQPRHDRPANGQFKCIRLATGKVCWATDRTGHASLVAADGKLVLLSETGELILVRATPERYEELGRTRVLTGGMCWTAPSLQGRRLFVRNQSEAVCVYLGSPDELGREGAGAVVAQAPAPPGWQARLEQAWRGPPLYAPSRGDMLRWYGFCMAGVFAVAKLLSWLVRVVVRRAGCERTIFAGAAFVFGAAGTLAFSAATRQFTFTWPAAVFVAFQAVLIAANRARRGGVRAQWGVRGALVGFVGLCLVYAWLCRSVFVPMGYGFLAGLLPALPVAVLAARRIGPRSRPLADLCWGAASFTVYFWASALVTMWRTGL